MLKKNKTKELKKPGLTWYPYIMLKEKDIPAILNPFCRMPVADTLAPKFRKKLPQSLTNTSLSHSQVAFLTEQLNNCFLMLELTKMPDAALCEFIGKVCESASIESVKPFEQKEGESKRAALVIFKNAKSAVDFTIAASKNDLRMLDSEKIARMLLSSLTTVNAQLGYDSTTTEMAKKFI